jgi:type VI secretion system secreted protein Hcp
MLESHQLTVHSATRQRDLPTLRESDRAREVFMKLQQIAGIAAIGIASASTLAMADQMFLKFVGSPAAGEILGGSTDPQHLNEIAVVSYSLGIDAESSWTKGGASVGKPNPGKLNFEHYFDTSIPAMVKYIATGSAAPLATLTVRSDPKGNKAGFEYAKYTFEDFFFTSVGQVLNGEGRPVSAVSGVYKSLKVQIFAPGDPIAVSCVRWDVPSGATSDCR